MEKKQLALEAHHKHFNCAQSVFYAFAEDVSVDKETALKTAACFGGGMRCGEVCGAVTGALMAIGLKYGSSEENDLIGKESVYEKSAVFMKKFKESNGSILCRDLLRCNMGNPDERKQVVQKGLNITVCEKAILNAVEILEEIF